MITESTAEICQADLEVEDKIKTFCSNCGVHFPIDFPRTLVPPCNFWGEHGMSTLPEENKKRIWDWLFAMPTDELTKFSLQLAFTFEAKPFDQADTFAIMVPGWEEMSDADRQEYERQHFNYIVKHGHSPTADKIKVKKKVVN